jgi:hypothetical protein
MPRRPARSREEEISRRSTAIADLVSSNDAPADALAEEKRQVRAALTEYFSILLEWSLNSRQDSIQTTRDPLVP